MIYSAYRALLRLPAFRGRDRLAAVLRRALAPPTAPVDGGLTMALDPLEWLQVQLLAGEEQEPLTIAAMRRLLAAGNTCIDVGSHVGFHALTAAKAVGPTGRVITIDPQPYNADKVLTNSALNGLANILVIVAAAGRTGGRVVLHNQKPTDKARLTLSGAGVGDVGPRFEVPVVTLDQIHRDHGLGPIKLLKIDVEGYEAEVLAGATAALAATETVIFECLPEGDSAALDEAVRILTDGGFQLQTLHGLPWEPGRPAAENNVVATRGRIDWPRPRQGTAPRRS